MRSQDTKIRQMLQDLGQALAQAMSDSEEVNEVVRRIREEGYSLQLLLDYKQDRQRNVHIELADPPPHQRRLLPASTAENARPPGFRLASDDVEWLKELGIDPTRSVRRRRGNTR